MRFFAAVFVLNYNVTDHRECEFCVEKCLVHNIVYSAI